MLTAAVLLLSTSSASARPALRIGSKTFTESVILGELARLITGDCHGSASTHRREIGGSRVLFEALKRGDIDLYPEYLGTITQSLMPQDSQLTPDAWLASQDLRRSEPLGFENGYGLAMREDVAARLRIRKLSDLRRHPTLRYGLTSEFIHREDGFRALVAHYGLQVKEPAGMMHQVAYRAIASDRVQVMDVYTTDGELASYQLRILEDDQGFFPSYDAVWLYRAKLTTSAPRCLRALEQVSGRISATMMQRTNAGAQGQAQAATRLAQELSAALDLGAGSLTGVASTLSRRLYERTLEHLMLVLIALLAAFPIALPLGIWAAYYRRVGRIVLAAVGVLQTLPSLALLVLLVPILGVGTGPAVVALFLYALLPIVKNTQLGLLGIDRRTRESAAVLGLTPFDQLRLVELPLALPDIFAGLRIATVVSIGTATLGALVGAGGYGQPILSGIRTAHVPTLLEGALPAAAMALVAQASLSLLERWLVPRGLREQRGRQQDTAT